MKSAFGSKLSVIMLYSWLTTCIQQFAFQTPLYFIKNPNSWVPQSQIWVLLTMRDTSNYSSVRANAFPKWILDTVMSWHYATSLDPQLVRFVMWFGLPALISVGNRSTLIALTQWAFGPKIISFNNRQKVSCAGFVLKSRRLLISATA